MLNFIAIDLQVTTVRDIQDHTNLIFLADSIQSNDEKMFKLRQLPHY